LSRVSRPLIKAFRVEIATLNVARDSRPPSAIELVFTGLTEKIPFSGDTQSHGPINTELDMGPVERPTKSKHIGVS